MRTNVPWQNANQYPVAECEPISMTRAQLKAIVVLPGTAIVYGPALLLWLTAGTRYAASGLPSSLGHRIDALFLGAVGWILIIKTIGLFHSKGGGGTLAPWDPIQNFVAEGPYRHVRNPMLLGVHLVLIAEALLIGSLPILLWMFVFAALNTVYFWAFEEPQLARRFGKTYLDYKRAVPRWIPRWTPYAPEP